MASKQPMPHFVLIPFPAQGHLIPMVDVGKVLAQHGTTVTIVTTDANAARFETTIDRARKSGLPIHLVCLRFPGPDVGVPAGWENVDSLPSMDLLPNFLAAIKMLEQPSEELLQGFSDPPSCIISDHLMYWSAHIAAKLSVPWIQFDGTSCFNLLCTNILRTTKVYEQVSETDRFVVPGLPDRVEFTRQQLPGAFKQAAGTGPLQALREEIRATEKMAYGVLVNSFEELEPGYAEQWRKVKDKKMWCIGPVSLSNREESDKAQRGNKPSIDETKCMKWLDAWPARSVVYASLGSVSRLSPLQIIELGLGLEESNWPFIWVVRENDKVEDLKKWAIEEGFEERVKDRGLVIWGWAPQVLILSHPAVGGFLTHCGWNSTLEGVCEGVPMVTWPLFSDQFFNEKMVVDMVRVGVRVGATVAAQWGEEEKLGVMVRRDDVRKGVIELMEEEGEGIERRRRAEEVQGKAKRAVEQGGSSSVNVGLLINDVMKFNSGCRVEI